MAYALPPILEYDTSCPPSKNEIDLVEWVYGCPAEFYLALIDINARCTLDYVAPDWQDIERRIVSWQLELDNSGDESWKQIARAAVHETWRQTLLAYLYMVSYSYSIKTPNLNVSFA